MADRVILTRLETLGAVGVYTIGYSLAQGLQMVVTSANNSIMPEFAQAGGDQDAFERLPTMATYYLLFAATATLGMVLFLPIFIQVFLPTNYHEAIGLIPWLGLAFFSVALYYVPMNVLSQTQRNTRIVPLLTITAAGVNIGLNFILIPSYGIVGAAVSTLAAYLVLAITVFAYSQYISWVPYEFRRIGIVVSLLVLLVVGEMILPNLTSGLDFLIRVALFVGFFIAVTSLGFWDDEEVESLKGIVTKVQLKLR